MKFTNLAKTELASQLLSSGNTFNVVAGKGAKFPAIGDTNLFMGMIWGSSFATPFDDPDYEIVVGYRSATDQITVARAQENTVAKQWEIGDNFMLTSTAGTFGRYETHELTAKTAVVDADEFRIWDSVTSLFKKITFANLKATLKSYFDTLYPPNDGWVPAMGTWSASDGNTISIAGLDLTGTLQKGDKIKLTNNSSVKYYYITTTPVFSTNTTFDVTGESVLVAGAIASPYYSKILNPQGMIDGTINYKCSVYRSGQLNIAQNVDARITYNAETFDTGNNFDAVTNNVFFAPISGYYNVNVVVFWLTLLTGENITLSIKVDGATALSKAINIAATTYGLDTSLGGLVYLTKGQYIEVTTKHDGAHATADIEFSRLMISFVSV